MNMLTHQVRLHVETPPRRDRIHLLLRIAVLAILGSICWSTVYWVAYLALPTVTALLISREGPIGYLKAEAPGIARALRWVAAAYAYLWLLTDDVPTSRSIASVHFEVDPSGAPSPGSAMLRLVKSVPAIFVAVVLTMVAGMLWVVAAVTILIAQRVPSSIVDFFAQVLRYRFRLAAYHLSLVDEYPSLTDAPEMHMPHSDAA
jgi:hypothetical protein